MLTIVITMMVPVQLGVIPLYIEMIHLHWVNDLKAVIAPNLVSAFGVFLMRQYIVQAVRTSSSTRHGSTAATRWRVFWHVVLPAVRPVAAVLGLLTFTMTWNDFFWPLIVLSSQHPTVQVAVSALASGYVEDYALVLTGTFISILPLLVLFLVPRPPDHRRDHAGGGQGMTTSASDRARRGRAARRSRTASSGAPRPRRTRSRAPSTRTGAGRSIWDTYAHTPGTDRERRHRRRRRRPLPPLPRGRGADARARARRRTASRSPGRASSPAAAGPPNERGLDFYRRLVDALLEAGIEPVPDALPLGPPAGAAGRRRLAVTRDRLPLCGVRRDRRATRSATAFGT